MHEVGKHIAEDVAAEAAEVSGGYPYMIQLVGHYMWQSSDRRKSQDIEHEDVERAGRDAARSFQDAVCAPAFRGLTKAQKDFCLAMLEDDPSPSAVREVAQRAGRSVAWANRYRKSLIDAHIIASAAPGMVHFDVPFFADYLRRAQG